MVLERSLRAYNSHRLLGRMSLPAGTVLDHMGHSYCWRRLGADGNIPLVLLGRCSVAEGQGLAVCYRMAQDL